MVIILSARCEKIVNNLVVWFLHCRLLSAVFFRGSLQESLTRMCHTFLTLHLSLQYNVGPSISIFEIFETTYMKYMYVQNIFERNISLCSPSYLCALIS